MKICENLVCLSPVFQKAQIEPDIFFSVGFLILRNFFLRMFFSVELSTFQQPPPPAPQVLKGQIYSIKYPSDCWYVDLLRGFVCKLIYFFGARLLVPTPRWLLSSALSARRWDNWKRPVGYNSPCQHPDFTPYLAYIYLFMCFAFILLWRNKS
jgi:hypothetical protein